MAHLCRLLVEHFPGQLIHVFTPDEILKSRT